MRILVTGGAGFIGSHVADLLLEAGHAVVVVDNLHTGHSANVPPAASFFEADITDADRMNAIFASEGIDGVSHQAALANVRESMTHPLDYARVNVLGTLTLLEAARKHNCRKFVFASTGGAVYGEGYSPDGDRLPFTEKSWPQPKDNYGANKLSAEYHLDLYYHAYGLEHVALRYPNVYGPRQDSKGEAGVVAIFAGAMLNGQPTRINGDGLQSRDFAFVRDIAHANLLALEGSATGVINVGTGVPTSINTIHRTLSDITGYSLEPAYAPRPVGEVLETYLDSTKAAEVLHWQPTVSLEEGLQDTVDWMRTAQPA